MDHFLPGLLIGLLGGVVGTSIVLILRLRSHRSRVGRTLRRIRAAARRRAIRLETRAQSAQRLAELGTLTGGLAHEIKNPLSTVLLNLQLLQEDLNPNDPAHS